MAEQFSWIPFYEETATRLLEWESKQGELIAFLKKLSDSGLPVTRVKDKDAQANPLLLEEIDPFTFMGAFNRGITPENRRAIIDEVATFLRINNPKPSDFDGVPVLNNMKSWFFGYKAERKIGDIGQLWQVLRYGLEENPFNNTRFIEAFDQALQVKNVNVNLTMGLFWSRPRRFLALDQTNRNFLNIKLPPGGLTAKSYQEILKKFEGKSFPELSAKAWQAANDSDESAQPISQAAEVWFVGAYWDNREPADQTERFLSEGIWQNGYDDKLLSEVRSMKVGDLIAIKAAGTQKYGLPFDARGKTVSRMTIKAIGTIVANRGDGKTVEVEWDKKFSPKQWYFYTNQQTLWKINLEAGYRLRDMADKLLAFTFKNAPQDYDWFVKQWWDEMAPEQPSSLTDSHVDDIPRPSVPYAVEDMIDEGVFLSEVDLQKIIDRLHVKKNLILQGPPGVGKTFLARKLAHALLHEKADARVEMVQFHQSYSYEDFICGYRPASGSAGQFELQDGVFRRFCRQAESDPGADYVFIIDEINRGNISQIFGEVLMLIEADKRGQRIPLLYSKSSEERFGIPLNLYIIGLMNLADRSLAMVDYALRRRFAFVSLEPSYANEQFRKWLDDRNMEKALIDKVVSRMGKLNELIRKDPLLGSHYEIGHSYFCPNGEDYAHLTDDWYQQVIETEVLPLLEEYWFDNKERINEVRKVLL